MELWATPFVAGEIDPIATSSRDGILPCDLGRSGTHSRHRNGLCVASDRPCHPDLVILTQTLRNRLRFAATAKWPVIACAGLRWILPGLGQHHTTPDLRRQRGGCIPIRHGTGVQLMRQSCAFSAQSRTRTGVAVASCPHRTQNLTKRR